MSTPARSFFRIRFRTIIFLLVVAMVFWSAASYWNEYSENAARRARELLAPPVGVECLIEYEGEGVRSLVGAIVDQSDRWIVVRPSSDPNTPTKPVWIPRERVLMIEVR